MVDFLVDHEKHNVGIVLASIFVLITWFLGIHKSDDYSFLRAQMATIYPVESGTEFSVVESWIGIGSHCRQTTD
jgi:urea transporter